MHTHTAFATGRTLLTTHLCVALVRMWQIVTMLEHIYSVDNLPGPFLVVVPLSTIEHWRRELQVRAAVRHLLPE